MDECCVKLSTFLPLTYGEKVSLWTGKGNRKNVLE